MPVWIVQIIIAIVLMITAYLLAPKPKTPQSNATTDTDKPTADASRPVPVVFGDVTIKSPNCLWYGEISSQEVKVKA